MKLSTLAYIRKNGKTLMLHRNKRDQDFHKGKFNGIGGKFEPGESPEECLIREVKEETGYEVLSYQYEGIITFPCFDGVEDWYTFVYTIHDFSGEQIDPEEGTLHWVKDEELTSLNLWAGDPYFLEWIYQRQDKSKKFSAKFYYEDKQYIRHQVTFI